MSDIEKKKRPKRRSGGRERRNKGLGLDFISKRLVLLSINSYIRIEY